MFIPSKFLHSCSKKKCFVFFRAIREGNWELHLFTVPLMLTWHFARDRVNYSRYGTAYWFEMTKLQETHSGNIRIVPQCFNVTDKIVVDILLRSRLLHQMVYKYN